MKPRCYYGDVHSDCHGARDSTFFLHEKCPDSRDKIMHLGSITNVMENKLTQPSTHVHSAVDWRVIDTALVL